MKYFFVFFVLFACEKSQSNRGSLDTELVLDGESKGFFLSPLHGGDVDFVSLAETEFQLPYYPSQKLIGGAEAKPEDFPANFYTTQGNSRCSGTLIGEKTLISAAHCVGNGKTATLTYKNERYTGTCTHHPDYRGNATADWALCYLDRAVVGIPFEKMLTDLSLLKVGGTVQLSGFGCVSPGGGGGNDGKFRIGNATITKLPSGNDHDTVTRGGAALCYGDSGGSAYIYTSATDRQVFGINSRGDIRVQSYLVTADSKMVNWATNWAVGKDKLCGFHADARNCRGSDAPEPPSQCKIAVDYITSCIFKGTCKTPETREVSEKSFATVGACLEESWRVD